MPFGLLGLVWGLLTGHPLAGLLWLLATCVNRWAMAAVVLWALEDEQAAAMRFALDRLEATQLARAAAGG